MEDNKEILKGLADNPALFEAVKKVILSHFDIPNLKSDMSNELLGQLVKARLIGLQQVEEAFKEISRHKSTKKLVDTVNPAY